LSGREVEVLELVAAGRSNVHHIFGKLLVRNRSQAVARARELRLLG
jgi:ATP/maltotriose-dependent transcriptional regulator MalT